jgi:ATP-dependent Clp protease ATP-binding subunit ClpA
MAKAGKTIAVEDAALELVVVKGYSMAFGARFLKRFIDEHIKLPICVNWKSGSHFDVKAQDGQLVVEPGIGKVSAVAEALAFGDVA